VVTRNPGFLKSTKIGSVFTVFDKIGPVLKTKYSTVANRYCCSDHSVYQSVLSILKTGIVPVFESLLA
jgi:hypothetical protein